MWSRGSVAQLIKQNWEYSVNIIRSTSQYRYTIEFPSIPIHVRRNVTPSIWILLHCRSLRPSAIPTNLHCTHMSCPWIQVHYKHKYHIWNTVVSESWGGHSIRIMQWNVQKWNIVGYSSIARYGAFGKLTVHTNPIVFWHLSLFV